MDTLSAAPLRICVIEDSPSMSELIVAGLSHQGFVVNAFESAEALCQVMQDRTWDIAIIDVGLPGEDGFSLAARLRSHKKTCTMGLVMLTARGGVADRRQGSALADLYFIKPVDLIQLGAALTNLGRRVRAMSDTCHQQPHTESIEALGQGAWRLAERGYALLSPHHQSLKLSMQEHAFLHMLLDNQGRPVSRDVLVPALAYDSSDFDMHRMTVLVNRLRKKAEAGGMTLPLRTVRGMGYIFGG